MIQSVNPYDGTINATFQTLTDEQIIDKIHSAHQQYLLWSQTPTSYKKQLMYQLAQVIQDDLQEIAKLETIEMGRLYTQAYTGLQGTIGLIKWFADHTEEILADQHRSDQGMTGHIQYDPLGVIFGIAPRNFPYNQVLRAAVPTILAGNTILYKHASNVPLCAQKIEQCFLQAGFPQGVYTNMFVQSSQTELILGHPLIMGTNVTGGEATGRAVGSLAGKYLKPSILELGGNDAFVVLPHHDMDALVAQAVTARISNAGQKCNSSKRFIILDEYYEQFCEKMSQTMSILRMGDPMDPQTQLGPLAKAELVQEIHRQVQETISQGAKCLTGGVLPTSQGHFYPPTVLADVTSNMTTYQQEVFGPVASIIRSSSIEESIRIANDSQFGLCACVYGDDPEQCKKVARHIQAGMVFVNQPAGSRAFLPFGGIKQSGYGKENGPEGLKAFTNKKVVVYSG